MNEPIYITEEELEYFTNVPDMINEGNDMNYSSEEEYESLRATGELYTLEEFSNAIDEAIRRKIPNP